MERLLRASGCLAALLSVVLLISCATNPVTGERELVFMTEADEIALGQQSDPQIIATYGLYQDAGLQAYVNEIGQRLAAGSHRPHLQWHFKVLDTEVVNAFAVPGGYVYITRGLLTHMNSEAELAGVLGHEIGHITARHSVRQYTRQMIFLGGILLGSALSEEFRRWAPAAMVGVQLLFLKYSRDQERQADDLGVLYSYHCGYDTLEFSKFFVMLNRMKEETGGGSLPGWLSTHPVTDLRYRDVQDEAQRLMAAEPPQSQLVIGRNQFLQQIDGVVYGANPRHGYAENGVFYHPEMAFRFDYPGEWKLVNTNAAVQAGPESGDAVLRLTAQQSASSPRQVFNEFSQENNLRVLDADNSSINGLQSYRAVCNYSDSEGNSLRLIAACVKKDGIVYSFLGASQPGDFNRYFPSFRSSINSFRRLTDRNALNRQPIRLHVNSIGRGEQADNYFRRSRVPSDYIDDVMLINLVQPSDTLPANSLVKIVR